MGDVELGPRAGAGGGPPSLSGRASDDALLAPHARRRRSCDALANAPHPHCNAAALTASATALLFMSLWIFAPRTPRGVSGPRGDAAFAPEGGLSGSFATARDYRGAPRQVSTAGGVVAADHGRCSDVGAATLRRGGNAADAAAAAALCQGVLNPMASGVGGGTIILWRGADGRAEVIDGRETAPAAAVPDLFTNPNSTLDGGLAVATPLELIALHTLVVRHGSGNVSWAEIVEPAATLARAPWPAHPYYVSAVSSPGTLARLRSHPALAAAFLVPGGRGKPARPPRVGEKCCARPALAATLDAVGAGGPAALYTDRAAALAADVRAAGGVLTEADVKSAAARVTQPLTARVWGLDLLFPPPPSAAASLALAAAIAAGYETPPTFGGHGGGAHRLVEAAKHGMALRASLGDPGGCGGGVDVGADGQPRRRKLAQAAGGGPAAGACFDHTAHVAQLLADAVDPAFADALRATVNDSATQPPAAYGGRWGLGGAGGAALPPDDRGTSHLLAIDAARNAVSLTTTVNTAFGSGVLSEATGVLLNNQMDDFSVAGRANGYGLAAQPANYVAPHKKPLSSMAPIMLVAPPRAPGAPGALRAVAGASGGPRILTAVLATLVRLVEGGDAPLAAVAAPRLHHQLLPDAVFAEDWSAGQLVERVPPRITTGLEARGHAIRHAGWGAVVQAATLAEDGGSVDAASDPRKDGAPAVA